MFGLATHLIVKNAPQKHLLVSLPQLRVKLVRAVFGGRRDVGYRRTIIDLGSFKQLRNPDNFPGRLQGDAFPVHNSRDTMGGRVNEDVIGGYIVVKKGKGFDIAGLWREKNRENGE
jgi:hypothetical protein